MSSDFRLEARRAIVTRLNGVVSAPVHGEYPDGEPAYPFVLVAGGTVVPFRPSCTAGSAVAIPVHSFGSGKSTDAALGLSSEVVTALNDDVFAFEGKSVHFNWLGGVAPIRTEKGWQVVNDFNVTVFVEA